MSVINLDHPRPPAPRPGYCFKCGSDLSAEGFVAAYKGALPEGEEVAIFLHPACAREFALELAFDGGWARRVAEENPPH